MGRAFDNRPHFDDSQMNIQKWNVRTPRRLLQITTSAPDTSSSPQNATSAPDTSSSPQNATSAPNFSSSPQNATLQNATSVPNITSPSPQGGVISFPPPSSLPSAVIFVIAAFATIIGFCCVVLATVYIRRTCINSAMSRQLSHSAAAGLKQKQILEQVEVDYSAAVAASAAASAPVLHSASSSDQIQHTHQHKLQQHHHHHPESSRLTNAPKPPVAASSLQALALTQHQEQQYRQLEQGFIDTSLLRQKAESVRQQQQQARLREAEEEHRQRQEEELLRHQQIQKEQQQQQQEQQQHLQEQQRRMLEAYDRYKTALLNPDSDVLLHNQLKVLRQLQVQRYDEQEQQQPQEQQQKEQQQQLPAIVATSRILESANSTIDSTIANVSNEKGPKKFGGGTDAKTSSELVAQLQQLNIGYSQQKQKLMQPPHSHGMVLQQQTNMTQELQGPDQRHQQHVASQRGQEEAGRHEQIQNRDSLVESSNLPEQSGDYPSQLPGRGVSVSEESGLGGGGGGGDEDRGVALPLTVSSTGHPPSESDSVAGNTPFLVSLLEKLKSFPWVGKQMIKLGLSRGHQRFKCCKCAGLAEIQLKELLVDRGARLLVPSSPLLPKLHDMSLPQPRIPCISCGAPMGISCYRQDAFGGDKPTCIRLIRAVLEAGAVGDVDGAQAAAIESLGVADVFWVE